MSHWTQTKDGDPQVLALYERHYSAYRYADRRPRRLCVGPGQKLVLKTPDGLAAFAWRKFASAAGETGVNCAFFRNEGPYLSSALILEAEQLAWQRWPGARLYTYVAPAKIRSSNPGFCFLQAGWRRLQRTTRKRQRRILEKLPKL